MSLSVVGDVPIHFPEKSVFEFDAEVSDIFTDMAVRSIPMYNEVQRLHVSMMLAAFYGQPELRVADVGASRGRTYREICNQLQETYGDGCVTSQYTAIDTSPHMLNRLSDDYPEVETVLVNGVDLPDLPVKQHAIFMLYVLQFIKSEYTRLEYIQWAFNNLVPGGMLVFGSKVSTPSTSLLGFTKEYIGFRKRNGYSDEEIQAKTLALSGSMWPLSADFFNKAATAVGFCDNYQTTRWLQFVTGVAIK